MSAGNADPNYHTVFGDADVLRGHAAGGDDRFSGLANTVVAVGDARLMLGHSRGGDDVFRVIAFTHAAFGDAEILTAHAKDGNDDLVGASGMGARSGAINHLYGDAYAMSGWTQGGDDRVAGGGVYPGSVNHLYGDAYHMSGHARAGNDTLITGRFARNEMWGDAAMIEGRHVETGCDTFVITYLSGQNTIHDFEHGKDVIDLRDYASHGIHEFSDLAQYQTGTSSYTFHQSGGISSPLVVNSLTVLGDQALSASDFLFA